MKKFYLKFAFLTLFSSTAFAQTYVTPTGAGTKDGSSWSNAFDGTQLQQAINGSAAGSQVWVTKGTYKPTEILSTTVFLADSVTASTTSDRDKAFVLKAGVEIYGGFVGTEITINDRVNISTTNETILSGDLNDSNTADAGDAYHVVAARNDADGAVLDGFTIQHGYGDSSDNSEIDGTQYIKRNIGAAIAFFSTKTLTFRNLLVKNNKTNNAGGAIYSRSTSADAKFDFINVRFEDNEAAGTGGVVYAMADLGASQLNFTNCVFLNNKGGGSNGGGAIYFAGDSNDAILNVTANNFENNETASTYGGAMRIGTGIANISNTVFKGGKAGSRGGAIYSTGGSTVTANGCRFENNISSGSAGHWYVYSGSANISNSNFTGGSSTTSGGAIYMNTGTLTITSSTISTNASTTAGGALYVAGGVATIVSSKFNGNTSTTAGGALYIAGGATANISKSDFFLNIGTTGGGAIYATGEVNISKSRLHSNNSPDRGGALYLYSNSTSNGIINVNNSSFYNNSADGAGTTNTAGAVAYLSRAAAGQSATLTAINNTFYANKSPNSPHGAISFNGFSTVTINLYNNIFNGNTGDGSTSGTNYGDVRRATSATQNYSNNLFQGPISTGGARTVTNEYVLNEVTPQPLFASTTSTDFNFLYPTSDSFAIDKGDNAQYTAVGDINTDTHLAGYARLNGANIDLGAIEYAAVLPVTISSFSAKLANNRTQLRWTVGTEDNVNSYEVERSQNGTDFVKVAETKATLANAYSVTDANPQVGVNYYRLKTLDNDGKFSHYGSLQTVNVSALTTANVKVYPNPVKGGIINVSLSGYPAGTYQAKLVSTAGVAVQQNIVNYDGTKDISFTSTAPAGLYTLHLVKGDVKVAVKLIKQ